MNNSGKFRGYLEVASNVVVLVAALAFVGTVGWNYFNRAQAAPLQSGLSKGDTFPRLASVNYGDSKKTVIVVMSSRCHFCQESVPFYKHLAELRSGAPGQSFQLAAVFPESADAVRQYIERNQLNFDATAPANLRDLQIAGTPTVIVVDGSGRVLDFWVGKLTPEAEQEVITTLNG